ncbi:MAG: hypothetical protein WKF47_16495 [Geodermatophilaceae bacterium]
MQVWHYPYTYDFPTIWPEASNLGPTILVELQQTVNTVMAERAAAGEPAVPISVKVNRGGRRGRTQRGRAGNCPAGARRPAPQPAPRLGQPDVHQPPALPCRRRSGRRPPA